MRVAIIGSGISGLVCAAKLAKRNDVEVFERNDWIGGHTHTVDVEHEGGEYAVDTGFIVYNERNYPNFSTMLAELEVETQPTRMTFGFSSERTGLEYSGSSLDGIFARNLARGATAVADGRWGDDPGFGGAQVLDGDLDSYWAAAAGRHDGAVTLDLDAETTFDVILLQEPIALGQRVLRYRVEIQAAGLWRTVSEGTTIGHKKLDVLAAPVTASRVRVVAEDALAEPLIAERLIVPIPST